MMLKAVWCKQLCRFCLIGGGAASLHVGTVVLLVQVMGMEPLLANVLGFAFGFQLSYWGHRQYTFNGTAACHQIAVPKLLSLQIMCFITNEYLFYFFLGRHWPYPIALFIVLAIMPFFTFMVSKFWVFRFSV